MKKEYILRNNELLMVRLAETGMGTGSHWRLYSLDGRVVDQGKARLFGEWPENIEDEIAAKIAEYADAAQCAPAYEAYLRFKDIPKGGRSRNYETGTLEAGVSVYALKWDVLGKAWEIVMTGNPLQYILNDFRGDEVPAYIVTGEHVGNGSDGEPLIRDAEIVGRASKTESGDWVLA